MYFSTNNIIVAVFLQFVYLNGETAEERHGFAYNQYLAPSTLNFNDIYTNSLAMLSDDSTNPTAKDEEYHLNNLPTHYIEFQPKTQTIIPSTPPPPKYILSSSALNDTDEDTTTTESTTTSSTTEEPEPELPISVIPIKNQNYQRGVLDLLFPAGRVKTFKSVFDTFRKLLSHTFR